MSSHENDKGVNARRWTETEFELFAHVLVDEKNEFAKCLEKLASKKASNSEMFDRIRIEFKKAMDCKSFVQKNIKHFKDGKIPADLNCDIDKLRNRYKVLKQEWCRRINRCNYNSISHQSAGDPPWFKVLHPIFSELIDPTKMHNQAISEKPSFVNSDECVEVTVFDGIDIDNERQNYTMCETRDFINTDRMNGTNSEDNDRVNTFNEETNENEENEEIDSQEQSRNLEKNCHNNTRKSYRRPYKHFCQEETSSEPIKKQKISTDDHENAIRAHTRMLEKIAQCFTDSISAQDKRFELQMKEIRDREERLLRFRSEEAEKDRQHEYRMAELFLALGRPMPPAVNHRNRYDIPIVSVPNAEPLNVLKKNFSGSDLQSNDSSNT